MKVLNLHLYYPEPVQLYTGEFGNKLSHVNQRSLNVGEFTMAPVNSGFAPSLTGLGYLYTKIVMTQPAINQEAYVMQTAAQLAGMINSGN